MMLFIVIHVSQQTNFVHEAFNVIISTIQLTLYNIQCELYCGYNYIGYILN
jgi:hypothetical protein